MDIDLGEGAKKLGISTSRSVLSGVTVKPSRKQVFDILAKEIRTELEERFNGPNDLLKDPIIKALRSFYWRIGIDPTKTRPSSEALVRRLFRKGVPMINNMVDAGNLASMRSFIPVGLYDIERIRGGLVLDLSEGGEEFRGIGSTVEKLPDGIPVLKDGEGVVHLYPHRDCMRTRITDSTSEVLVVSCGTREMRRSNIDGVIEMVDHYYQQLRV